VAFIRTDVSEDRIASIFRVHECEQVTVRSGKLLYRQRLVEYYEYSTTRCLYKSLPGLDIPVFKTKQTL
jgi:hypothetical protein